jgi:hypothetical protein
MGGILQVLVDTSLTVTQTFTVEGSPIDVDTGLPTVTATYPSGTALTPTPTVSGSWTGRTTGQYRFVLDTEPEVTWLDYEMTGTIGGKIQRLKGRVEWLGAQLFTIAEMRAFRVANSTPFASAVTYPDSRLQEVRAATLDEFENTLDFSPVPRHSGREVHSIPYGGPIILHKQKPTRILAISVNGTVGIPANYLLEGKSVYPVTAYRAGSWSGLGWGNVVVEYQHGLDLVPGEGRNMAMLTAANMLDPGISSSATQVTTPDGSSYSFDTAGQVTRGGTTRRFGQAKVDAWLNAWAAPRTGVA